MTPEQLQQAIKTLKQANTPATRFIQEPQIAYLHCESHRPANSQALHNFIVDFKPQAGWICWQNAVSYFPPKAFAYPQDQVLLYAEFAKPNISLHVNEDGQGGWIVTEYQEGKGKTHFAVTDTRFRGEAKHAPSLLNYRVYWEHTTDHGFRQKIARFCGFQTSEN